MKTLKNGTYCFISSSYEMIPTTKKFSNARVLSSNDGIVKVHWLGNYNIYGDFSTELMSFKFGHNVYTLDIDDKNKGNEIRKKICITKKLETPKYDYRLQQTECNEIISILKKLYLLEDSTNYKCKPISAAINELEELKI